MGLLACGTCKAKELTVELLRGEIAHLRYDLETERKERRLLNRSLVALVDARAAQMANSLDVPSLAPHVPVQIPSFEAGLSDHMDLRERMREAELEAARVEGEHAAALRATDALTD
jgi:hypothetical protein